MSPSVSRPVSPHAKLCAPVRCQASSLGQARAVSPMRRRRWARAAAAVCLAVVVVMELVAAGEGRRAQPLPPERARAHAHRGSGLPPSTGSASSLPVRHGEAAAGAFVGFNAAGARCKSGGRKAAGRLAPAAAAAACAEEDDDDKRRIPTGPNPLHNR